MWLNSTDDDEKKEKFGKLAGRFGGCTWLSLGGGREIKRHDSMNLASSKPADALVNDREL